MYGFLVFLSGSLLFTLHWDERNARFIPYLAVPLIILAATMLTRMLAQAFAGLHNLEASDKRESGIK